MIRLPSWRLQRSHSSGRFVNCDKYTWCARCEHFFCSLSFTNLISFNDLQFNVRKLPLSLLKVKNKKKAKKCNDTANEAKEKPNRTQKNHFDIYFIRPSYPPWRSAQRQQNLMKLSALREFFVHLKLRAAAHSWVFFVSRRFVIVLRSHFLLRFFISRAQESIFHW